MLEISTFNFHKCWGDDLGDHVQQFELWYKKRRETWTVLKLLFNSISKLICDIVASLVLRLFKQLLSAGQKRELEGDMGRSDRIFWTNKKD